MMSRFGFQSGNKTFALLLKPKKIAPAPRLLSTIEAALQREGDARLKDRARREKQEHHHFHRSALGRFHMDLTAP